MYNYHNKIFRSVSNSNNGEVTTETMFHYSQSGNIVTAVYQGGNILKGNLIALVGKNGQLDIRYLHINNNDQFMTGICISTPELLPNGKLRLHEKWQWTCADCSKGESVIEEI